MTTQLQTDNLKAMTALGAEWWNDSCDPEHLAEAVANGATGATSNPVIVETVVSANQERWLAVVRRLAQAQPDASAEKITWELIHEMGRQAAEILRPVYESSEGARGYLSLQVNPEFSGDSEAMFDQAVQLAGLAPNIAIKLPTTQRGLGVAERLVARGIPVNTTVSFSVAQAIAAAEAIERGLTQFAANGGDPTTVHPYVTIMVGRVGDYLGRIAEQRDDLEFDPELLVCSGVWVFRRAAAIFADRGFSATLLSAAYRHELQWSQIVGPDVLQSIPYAWWKTFQHAEVEVCNNVSEPADETQVAELRRLFPEYDLVFEPSGLALEDFEAFEATQTTFSQFCGGYRKLVQWVAGSIA
ncbi:MAG: hypothetical protein SynsKO_14870 [Synoicihabitans sp.]